MIHCCISNSCVPPLRDAPADFLEEGRRDLVDAIASLEVRCHLRVGQRRFKARDQVGRADNLLAEAAHQLQHARVDQRDVRNLVVGRVLHGDACDTA